MRVPGRTREQLQRDRWEVQSAKQQAVEAMVSEGRLHACADHIRAAPDCPRCEWVNWVLAGRPKDWCGPND